jgi:hypothetical protein
MTWRGHANFYASHYKTLMGAAGSQEVEDVFGTAGAALDLADRGNDIMGKLATGTLSKLASGFIKQKIETDVKRTFEYIDVGLNVFMGTIVLLIILLMGFMYLHLEDPDMACKLMTYFAFLSISLLSTTLVGAVVIKFGARSSHAAMFGPRGSIMGPVSDLWQENLLRDTREKSNQ